MTDHVASKGPQSGLEADSASVWPPTYLGQSKCVQCASKLI
jgi:hypothetical protein